MKTRVITAAVGIPALLFLLLAMPKEIVAVAWGMMLAVAVYEMLYHTGLVQESRLVVYACVMAFVLSIWSFFGAIHAYGLLILMVFVGVYFAEMMVSHVKITFDKVCMCIVAGAVMPFLLSSLIRILVMRIGRYVVLIPFVIAFGSDSGAYFAGKFLGQRKLAPVISQHKTVEGAFGGVLASVVLMVLYGLILQYAFELKVNYGLAILYGMVGAVAGVFGDLCLSVIKRQTGIKDYGTILPGHGGILDRFDSMMLVGPLVEAMLVLMPLATV
jgi:phosphatidate cytidylyltransferase